MFSIRYFKNLWVVPVLALPLLVWLLSAASVEAPGALSPERVNLALRRTADRLLRQSGDHTSRIPAIEQVGTSVWRVRLEQPFRYEELPATLQASLDLYGIQQPYNVTLRRCASAIIDLGYHQSDVRKDTVPCMGREMPTGCHFIEIAFLENEGKSSFGMAKSGVLLLLVGGLASFWFFQRQKPVPTSPDAAVETDSLAFGNSQLDVAAQVLISGDARQALTFRETKLLRLFASSPNQVLERDFILRQVWADEGVLVGRSVDMFVSRLRKKLVIDPSVGIAAVHGLGYRLETGKDYSG
ncbi:winged helix-turn-helix domain-containing protein [Haliscomenobacter sp.]|uniref:winged helix-turn-helix domain-containing protein n=1 Tax=Haliscomenobacter sp. TaxID=2717303 RepID=UPI003592F084